jgi:hypothetical protein
VVALSVAPPDGAAPDRGVDRRVRFAFGAAPLERPRPAPVVPAWLDDDAEVARKLGARRGSALPVDAWARVAVAAQLCAALARDAHTTAHGYVIADRITRTLADVMAPWSDARPLRSPGTRLTGTPGARWVDIAPLWRADLARCARVLASCLDGPEPSPALLADHVGYARSRVAGFRDASAAWLDHVAPARPFTTTLPLLLRRGVP